MPDPIHFCPHCGSRVQMRVPDDGDTQVRAVCPACERVHYQNPLNVVGTLPLWYGEPHPAYGHAHVHAADAGVSKPQVLLCRRNIEPGWGKWTLPAGFMELGETTAQGAARETREEAGAQFELQELFAVLNVVRVGQVHFFYRARLHSRRFLPGHETLEARLFFGDEIPWEDLAFRTVRATLQHFFQTPSTASTPTPVPDSVYSIDIE